MENCTKPNNSEATKVSLTNTISSKGLQDAFGVGRRTIARWAKLYGWTVYRISHKVIRYNKTEVEDSLSVTIDGPGE